MLTLDASSHVRNALRHAAVLRSCRSTELVCARQVTQPGSSVLVRCGWDSLAMASIA